MAKPLGFIVMESCDDYEQGLALEQSDNLPPGGILNWRESGRVAVFPSRRDARKAIQRTEHYRLAFDSGHPIKESCIVVPLALVEGSAQ